ncbi:hypothetical protein Ciccas_014357 [Cichlidogyrus casuarinus]|uniref:Uncharacterized protein n=1 Tax=Cichlidogyrus casuarinus TaxID=1844966 RepID=A0ABD2PKI1_9PLAT
MFLNEYYEEVKRCLEISQKMENAFSAEEGYEGILKAGRILETECLPLYETWMTSIGEGTKEMCIIWQILHLNLLLLLLGKMTNNENVSTSVKSMLSLIGPDPQQQPPLRRDLILLDENSDTDVWFIAPEYPTNDQDGAQH